MLIYFLDIPLFLAQDTDWRLLVNAHMYKFSRWHRHWTNVLWGNPIIEDFITNFYYSIIWIFYLIWHSLWKRRDRIALFIVDFVVNKYITSTDTRRIYFSSIYKYFFFIYEKNITSGACDYFGMSIVSILIRVVEWPFSEILIQKENTLDGVWRKINRRLAVLRGIYQEKERIRRQ